MIAVGLIIGLAFVLGLELWGVARSKRGETDTITELYRGFRDKLPKPIRLVVVWATVGLLVWAALHLAWDLV